MRTGDVGGAPQSSPSSAGGGQAPPWATDTGQPQPAHGGGAWQDQNGSWKWVPGSDPDPNLVSQWGSETITDPRRNPNGTPNTGAWLFSGHQQVWVWGATPDPNEVAKYGAAALTNPNNYPSNGASIPGSPGSPPPPDVAPPVVTDSSGGIAASLTGDVPPPGGDSSGNPGSQNSEADSGSQNINGQPGAPQPQAPPSHSPYSVTPDAVRSAATGLLGQIDTQVNGYDTLKNAVYQAVTGNVATDPDTFEAIHNSSNILLENYADLIAAMGGLEKQFEIGGQTYAHADMSSAVPQS
jgi:hypothetical protein